jgi:integrase
MRSIFNSAVDLDFIAKSPARHLQMPDTRTPDKTVIPPSTIMQILEGLPDPMDRCAFAIAVFCALRTSEVFGLTLGVLPRRTSGHQAHGIRRAVAAEQSQDNR